MPALDHSTTQPLNHLAYQSREMNDLTTPSSTTISDFQRLIRDMYFEKDVARGIDGTFMWLMEEVGELASALRNGSHEERLGEFADVLAWLATIANVAEVDLSEAIARKYGSGCPGCGKLVCTCDDAEKP
jgi:NTP pyrophosphatase (non-canonical NTP hydrolase)